MARPLFDGLIDVTKIDKSGLFDGKPREDGKKPKYMRVAIWAKPVDKFGNTASVSQGFSEEERAAGKKMIFIGDLKLKGAIDAQRPQTSTADEDPFA